MMLILLYFPDFVIKCCFKIFKKKNSYDHIDLYLKHYNAFLLILK